MAQGNPRLTKAETGPGLTNFWRPCGNCSGRDRRATPASGCPAVPHPGSVQEARSNAFRKFGLDQNRVSELPTEEAREKWGLTRFPPENRRFHPGKREIVSVPFFRTWQPASPGFGPGRKFPGNWTNGSCPAKARSIQAPGEFPKGIGASVSIRPSRRKKQYQAGTSFPFPNRNRNRDRYRDLESIHVEFLVSQSHVNSIPISISISNFGPCSAFLAENTNQTGGANTYPREYGNA